MNVRVCLHYCDIVHIYRFLILLLGTIIVEHAVRIAGERTKSDIPALLGPALLHRDRRVHPRYNVILRVAAENNSTTTLMNDSAFRRLSLHRNLDSSVIRNGWRAVQYVPSNRTYGFHRRKRRSISNYTSPDPGQQITVTTGPPAVTGSTRTVKIKSCHKAVVLTDLCWEVIVAVIFGSMGGSLILTIVVIAFVGDRKKVI